MSITIKKNPTHKLKIPEFLCDGCLKENVPPPYHLLVSGYKFTVLCSRPGGGKTSMLVALFKDKALLRKTYNNIILACPPESLKSMKNKHNPFKDLSEEKYFTSLQDIDVIREMVKYYASEKENSCIIIDDLASQLKDNHIQNILSDLVFNRRHYRCSIILLTQIYNRIPLSIRKLINVICVLYKPSKKEMENIVDELLEFKPEVVDEIMKISFNKQYDTLWIDVPTQRLYAGSDELIINDE